MGERVPGPVRLRIDPPLSWRGIPALPRRPRNYTTFPGQRQDAEKNAAPGLQTQTRVDILNNTPTVTITGLEEAGGETTSHDHSGNWKNAALADQLSVSVS